MAISGLAPACDALGMQHEPTDLVDSLVAARSGGLAVYRDVSDDGWRYGARDFRRRSSRPHGPVARGAISVDPVVDVYPLPVRIVIVGGLAAAAWGGVIGFAYLVIALARHLI